MRRVHPAVGILVVLWTMLTLGGLALSVIMYLYNRGTEPIDPGDPNIGLGMIWFAASMNLPTILFWLAIFWIERDHRSGQG